MNGLLSIFFLAACSYVNGHNMEDLNRNVATQNQFPYVVSLQQISLLPNITAHKCAGILVSYSHVLTTATCVTNGTNLINMTDYRVYSGNNLQDNVNLINRIRNISSIVRHPNYFGGPVYSNDIAVITLSQPFSNTVVSPLALNASATFKENDICTLPSWSERIQGVTTATSDLKYTSELVITNAVCSVSFSGLTLITNVDNNMMCSTPTHNYCLGDYGSPLVCNGNLVGLLILNTRCDLSNLPLVYTTVPNYYNWTSSIVGTTSSSYKTEFNVLSFFLISLAMLLIR